jgi:hypothetical protein
LVFAGHRAFTKLQSFLRTNLQPWVRATPTVFSLPIATNDPWADRTP